MTIPMDQFGNPTLAEYLAQMSLTLAQRSARSSTSSAPDLMARSDFALALVKLAARRI
jgi:dTDP-4-dehydrorhamnose reductase